MLRGLPKAIQANLVLYEKIEKIEFFYGGSHLESLRPRQGSGVAVTRCGHADLDALHSEHVQSA
jgi:hypothetical protein